MLLGGSGSLMPLPEIILQCLLAAVTVAWVWRCPAELQDVPRGAWIIAALMLAVPLCQLVPMPPLLWQSLPGRSLEHAALELVGRGSSWRPWSHDGPNRTRGLALLAMAAACGGMLVMAAAQDRRGRAILLATMAGMALLSVLVGAAQLSGGAWELPFVSTIPRRQFPRRLPDQSQRRGRCPADGHGGGGRGLRRTRPARRRRVGGRGQERQPPLHRQRAADPRLVLGMVGGASLLLVLGVLS